MTARETGERGEQLAALFYTRRGYTLLETNYRVRMGEIDLVLHKDSAYVFCEVKTRGAGAALAPKEAVDRQKQRRVIAAALHYLQKHRISDPFMRFDVVEVWLKEGETPRLRCTESAFEG